MDGDLALKYVRTRHQDSDLERLQRQQQVMLAIRDKAVSIGSINRGAGSIECRQRFTCRLI